MVTDHVFLTYHGDFPSISFLPAPTLSPAKKIERKKKLPNNYESFMNL